MWVVVGELGGGRGDSWVVVVETVGYWWASWIGVGETVGWWSKDDVNLRGSTQKKYSQKSILLFTNNY